ncbi:MAG TPA: dockerin type I domain-containing protein [Gemmataceae bacterium]|nr:dockerin type I domain-containing protein [Gemmataceae bacterium]
MAKSWLTYWFTNQLRPVRRPVRNKVYRGRFLPKVEPLDQRVLPTITATFTAAGGTLRVLGDDLDNTIVVSRDAGGTILVNNGAVAIQGGPATVVNTRQIVILGQGGNDNLSLNETNGTLPAVSLFGGDGNDVLTGGSGDDFVDGGTGNDIVFLGAGDDTFQWNPGDGSDVVDGQGGGRDGLVFNGSDLAETFTISDSGNGLPFHRVRLTRDLGNVTMDLNGIEDIDLNANGGADTITVNDLTSTDVFTVNLDLGGIGFGDGEADAVILNGTNGDDVGQIASFGTVISANASLFPFVNITGAEATNDTLTVNALGGNDEIDASALSDNSGFMSANSIGLTINGGAGNDTIVGSQGRDTFGWNPGDGSDTIDGQAGFDTLLFNGSDVSEKFDISANGNRVRFTRDFGNVTMDLGGVEDIDLNARGGADTITVNDLTPTDVFQVNLNLASSAGGGDGGADAVIVNGTDRDDTVQIEAFKNGTIIGVGGLDPKVNITGAEAANDTLTLNTLGGNDVVDSSTLPAGLIGLSVNLGDGQNPGLQVSSVVVDGGAAQRSRVTDLAVTFTGLATLPANPATAFQLTRVGPEGSTGDVTLAVDLSASTATQSIARLTFSGALTEFGSLTDGLYRLTILSAKVSGSSQPLDGDANGTAGGDFTLDLHRLYGDVNGDKAVNGLDLAELRKAFGASAADANYRSDLDFNGDGAINGSDLAAFRSRFGTILP